MEYYKLWDGLESKLVRAKNVRDALSYVERNEAPLGIVYATDAKVSATKVKIVATFPNESYGEVVYPAATVSDKAEAKKFLDFLKTPAAQAKFKESQPELNAIYLSLKIATIAILFALPVAILIAWILSRKQFWGKQLLNGIVQLPLVLPPVVIGYLLLIVMAKRGAIGQYLWEWFGFSFSFSWRGAVLASAVMAFPLMVRSIKQAFDAIDPKLEQAARTLGASPLKVFFTLNLPLSFSGVIAGAVLGFARSLGEFGATITFV